MARRWQRRRGRACCSRRACRLDTTFPKRTCGWTCWSRPTPVQHVPYKGRASYWSVRVGDKLSKDLVWGYPAPIPECPKIENLLSFYNEKLDIYVDGELQPRPVTPWS